MPGGTSPTLSICIATFRRATYIVETLDSILSQAPQEVEILVVDGASPDETSSVMSEYCRRHPRVRYIRELINSGVDADFDKAVGYATGDYCWLMTDDDLLLPGAITNVLAQLEKNFDLLILNAKVSNRNFSRTLRPRILEMVSDRYYDQTTNEQFFRDAADYLTFIGGVVIKKHLWLAREREKFYGTLFIHVGVIFQAAIQSIIIIAEPMIDIRYGNAMWGPHGFEIWMFKWPELIWSFLQFSDGAKNSVCSRKPYRLLRKLVWFRSIGAYSLAEYLKFFPGRFLFLPLLIALMPGGALNAFSALRCSLARSIDLAGIYDLAASRKATWLTRYLAKKVGV